MRCRSTSIFKRSGIALLVAGACLVFVTCSEELPLKIGFVGGLTGRVADLGVAGRDGVLLAVEEKNQAGGIAGRKVVLVVKDDRQSAEQALQVIRELIGEQVVAIIGPMTSSMAVVVQPAINSGRVVTVTPTAKTDQLSAQDDYFLRLMAPLSLNARALATHVTETLDLKRIAVVYDTTNREFTESWLNYFKEVLEITGGELVAVEEFASFPDVHFVPIAERLLKAEPQGVLLLCNAIDTALISQQIRKNGSDVPLFASEWAFTSDLINYGGRAVNGMTTLQSFDANSQAPDYTRFRENFIRRFGYAPSFATTSAYDAASLLFLGLEENPAREGLKETLLKIGTFPGLQSRVTFDRFGDAERPLFLTVVEDGQINALN